MAGEREGVGEMVYYDIERRDKPSEEAWFNCAKCGKEVRQTDFISLCQDCGEAEEERD